MLRPLGAFALSIAVLGASGCSSDPSNTTSEPGTTTDPSSTTADESTEATGSTLTDTDATTSSTTNTSIPSGSFYAPPEDIMALSDCDPWVQDCPEGEKCVPYASAGGEWNANKCVPVTGDGAAGETCTYAGAIEATDDCDETSICWNADDQGVGTCTEFCQGTPDEPVCPPEAACLIMGDGSVTVCIPSCDPINQDCDLGEGCYWDGMAFTCAPDAMGIPVGDPCSLINDCAPGLACVLAANVAGCLGESCCTAFCDTNVPMDCADVNLVCEAFFEPNAAPPGKDNVGICVMP